MLENGTIIDGKYEILSKVGQGGMSVVYLALNRKAMKQWAIKEVRRDGVKDFEVVKQSLVAETDMLKKLSHPNLPDIIDIIENEDNFLIVMDYIEGNPLSKSIEESGAQPESYVIEWAKQLCDVLDYLHTRKPPIIYRDMKPSNVMLKPDGQVSLIDFGTAREYKGTNIQDTTCLGTIGYAAPEQFGGQGETDARTDIYCLGATLYHLVTGHSPADPPYEMYPIRYWNEALSPGLEAIILKCTQKDPNDRFQSCAELRYALEHIDEGVYEYWVAQKKKFNLFLGSIIATLLCLVVGITGTVLGLLENKNLYRDYIARAESARTVDQKISNYVSALELDYTTNTQDTKNQFLALLEQYAANDGISADEANKYEVLLEGSDKGSSKEEYLKNKQADYFELCLKTGLWYMAEYQGNEKDQMQAAQGWFNKIPNEEYSDSVLANYSKLANYYKIITNYYVGAKDSTLDELDLAGDTTAYKDMFDALNEACKDMTIDNEVAKYRLYKVAANFLANPDNIPKALNQQVLLSDMKELSNLVFSTAGQMPSSQTARDFRTTILSLKESVDRNLEQNAQGT